MVPKLVSKEIAKRIGGKEEVNRWEDRLEEGEWGSLEESPHKSKENKQKNDN